MIRSIKAGGCYEGSRHRQRADGRVIPHSPPSFHSSPRSSSPVRCYAAPCCQGETAINAGGLSHQLTSSSCAPVCTLRRLPLRRRSPTPFVVHACPCLPLCLLQWASSLLLRTQDIGHHRCRACPPLLRRNHLSGLRVRPRRQRLVPRRAWPSQLIRLPRRSRAATRSGGRRTVRSSAGGGRRL